MRPTPELRPAQRLELGVWLAATAGLCLLLAVIWPGERTPRMLAAETATAPAAAALVPVEPPPAAIASIELAPAPAPPPAATVTKPERKVLRNPEATAQPSIKWINGKKYRYWKTLRMRVTAYAPDRRCCGPYDGTTTASGLSTRTNQGKLVAADTRLLPFHSAVEIPGYHNAEAVPVLDRGSAIKGHRLDVLLPTFEAAQRWGTRLVDVKVYKPVE